MVFTIFVNNTEAGELELLDVIGIHTNKGKVPLLELWIIIISATEFTPLNVWIDGEYILISDTLYPIVL
jgi:hypothetical protein